MSRFLNLICKVTRRCNLRCHYCNEWRDDPTVITSNVLRSLIQGATNSRGVQGVKFIWHGGEPLSCGIKFFENVVALQTASKRPEQQLKNTLQTNGVLVSTEWVEFFKRHNFHIGLSVDGPPELHDPQRPTVGGGGSHAQMLRGLRLMQEAEIAFGLLVVVTQKTLAYGADRMFEYLIDLGVKSFAFLHERPPSNPLAVYDPASDYVCTDSYSHYIKRIFDLWFEHGDPSIHIREFESIIGMTLGTRASVCTLAGNCIGKHFGIDVNGDVFHCDRYVTDPDYRLGNVLVDDFDQMRESARITELVRRNEQRLSRYKDCLWLPLCNGGCPHDSYIDSRSIPRINEHCCGQNDLVEHIIRRVRPDLERAEQQFGLPILAPTPSEAVRN